jgi:hypothetical protein
MPGYHSLKKKYERNGINVLSSITLRMAGRERLFLDA